MKNLLYSILLFLNLSSIYGAQSNFLVFTQEQIHTIKTAIKNNEQEIQPFVKELREFADYVINKGPWSVTYHQGKAISGNPHDYYSEGPYWWPDPDNPDGPYIRKDGLRNPDRFMAHKDGLQKMCQATAILSMAGYLLDRPEYSLRAQYLLKVWFTDESTKMNPHLDYGQAIPNKSPGRGVGIIDTHRLAKLITMLGFLDASGQWPDDDKEKLKQWFKNYLNWLLTSKNGVKEKEQGNNHSTWWAVQVAAYGTFTESNGTLPMVWEYARRNLIEQQIAANGSFPLEEKRTRSFDYSIFNLNAFTMLFRIAEIQGINLWQTVNTKDAGITTSLDYLYPYLKDPESWPGQQITQKTERELFSLIFAGEATGQNNLIELYKQKRKIRNYKSVKSYDPFILLINLYSCVID